MNYIQEYFKLPLAIVNNEDKADYFTALQESRKQEDTGIFIAFMMDQYANCLKMKFNNTGKISRRKRVGIKTEVYLYSSNSVLLL